MSTLCWCLKRQCKSPQYSITSLVSNNHAPLKRSCGPLSVYSYTEVYFEYRAVWYKHIGLQWQGIFYQFCPILTIFTRCRPDNKKIFTMSHPDNIHNVPSRQYSQCSVSTIFTMFRLDNIHNVPSRQSSQCSVPTIFTMFRPDNKIYSQCPIPTIFTMFRPTLFTIRPDNIHSVPSQQYSQGKLRFLTDARSGSCFH